LLLVSFVLAIRADNVLAVIVGGWVDGD